MAVSGNMADNPRGELAPVALARQCSEWGIDELVLGQRFSSHFFKESCIQFCMLDLWLCELNGPGRACKTASGQHCGLLGKEPGSMLPLWWLMGGVWGVGSMLPQC